MYNKKTIDKYTIFKMLGENIKELRLSKNITIKEFSEKTGIRLDYIRKIEKGQSFGLNLNQFCLIAEFLQVKPSELVKFDINYDINTKIPW